MMMTRTISWQWSILYVLVFCDGIILQCTMLVVPPVLKMGGHMLLTIGSSLPVSIIYSHRDGIIFVTETQLYSNH